MMASSYATEQPLNDSPPSGPGNVARLVDRLSKDISTTHGKSVPIKPPKPNNNNNAKMAHVRFSYVAQQDDELNLEEDDVIEVIEDVEDGWARGKLKDKVGLFPTNFVSFSTATTTNTSSYSSNLSRVNEEPRKKKEEPTPVATNGKSPVEKTPSTGSNVLPSTFKASIRKNGPNTNNGVSSAAAMNANSKGPKEYAKVLYEYKAINPDELDLREGDIVTVINRKCTDEGWCFGELNGKRGLFPENFVKITANNTGPPPSMSASGSTAPPVLPAKPLKPVGFGGLKKTAAEPAIETTNASQATITASTTSASNIQTTVTTTQSSDASSASTANTHRALEERKSVVAGIQSKLFPQGKFPPHKPTFQPPSNVLTSSQHSSRDPNAPPSVQMRHSVVDPTKMGLSSVHFDDQHLSDVGDSSDEPKQLESLTKFRPKQTNKRPPSTHFRSSKIIKAETPPTTPPLTPTSTNAPLSAVEAVAVTTGPATTSFPAESKSPAQQASPNSGVGSSRAHEVQSVVKELNSIVSSVNNASATKSNPSPTGQNTMGQKPSRNHSSGSTHSNFYSSGPSAPVDSTSDSNELISRSEFNEFRTEVLRRLAKLEERILKLDSTTEPGDRQQHF